MKKPKADRRIVSKGEYVANLGKKGLASSIGAALLLLSLMCTVLIGLFVWLIVSRKPQAALDAPLGLSMILFFGIFISAVVYIYRLGKREILTTLQMDVGVPLTRANTADLPAPDFLVRASEKPSEEQASILLRAAADTPVTLADQLLRPVTEEIMTERAPEENTLKAGAHANG